MPTCFIIQPFDNGKFDKRYRETFAPALQDAGLEPYRVDEDPSVDVLIDKIERSIRDAAICLAEISTDNPNVWYELGYAFACKKQVIMVCSDERKDGFPFDIRHRQVVEYKTESGGDFGELLRAISERAKALLDDLEQDRESSESVESSSLAESNEMYMRLLRIAADEMPIQEESISVRELKSAASQRGIEGMHFGLAFRKLEKDGFIEKYYTFLDGNIDESYEAVRLTEACWDWITENEPMFREDL